jgi:hypothetical protein
MDASRASSSRQFCQIARDRIGHLFPCRLPSQDLCSKTPGFCQDIIDWEKRDALSRIICWPANLFAFTSHVLGVTDAYKQTVCPSDSKGTWPPDLETVFGQDKRLSKKEREKQREAWKPVLDWLRAQDKNGPRAGDKNEPGWQRLVVACGKAWAHWLNDGVAFEDVARREKKAPPLTDREYLARLYTPLLAAWSRLFTLASERVEDVKEHELGRYVAGRTLCLFWNHVLGRLQADASEQGHGLFELHTDWPLFVSVMSLHAIADEAGLGWGTHKSQQFNPKPEDNEKHLRDLLHFVEALLDEHGTLALTPPDLCRVLPKRHTPTVGMTLRNLSLNLAFHQSSVIVKWHQQGQGFTREGEELKGPLSSMSILLLPWPLRIDGKDFQAQKRSPHVGGRNSQEPDEQGDHRYFSYTRCADGSALTAYVERAIREAKKETDSVDMVILPELAVTPDELDDFEAVLKHGHVLAYVTGVRGGMRNGLQVNAVYCRTWEPVKDGRCWPPYRSERPPSSYGPKFGPCAGKGNPERHEVQYKHHRWCLTSSQITQHQLGGVLSPVYDWWEGIFLDGQRSVRFVNIGGEITFCPLICEDLARQEPIGDLIRAVGPSLVVAILLDGPQIPERWSARYASVLADDPGSAVVTLTSLGMVNRCKTWPPRESRAIALWSDGVGPPRAIELDKDADAVLLSVAVTSKREVSADGREDGIPTNRATLGGVHQIRPEKGWDKTP